MTRYKIKTKYAKPSIKEYGTFNLQTLVQVKKWYGWVTIKKCPTDGFNRVSINHGDYLPNGKRNISYYELCAEELLEKLETND